MALTFHNPRTSDGIHVRISNKTSVLKSAGEMALVREKSFVRDDCGDMRGACRRQRSEVRLLSSRWCTRRITSRAPLPPVDTPAVPPLRGRLAQFVPSYFPRCHGPHLFL